MKTSPRSPDVIARTDTAGIFLEPVDAVFGTPTRRRRDGPVLLFSARTWIHWAVTGNRLPWAMAADPSLWSCPHIEEWISQAHRFITVDTRTTYRRDLHAYAAVLTRPGRYDRRVAATAIALGVEAVRVLSTGAVGRTVPEPARTHIAQVRAGQVDAGKVIAEIGMYESLLSHAGGPHLPRSADRAWAASWLHRTHDDHWGEPGRCPAESDHRGGHHPRPTS